MKLSQILTNTTILVFWLLFAYLSLFHQDAHQNVTFTRSLGTPALVATDIFLISIATTTALKVMDITTGRHGLDRVKKFYAFLFLGAGSLTFAFAQFFNAVATSSAEGATVVVEVWRQLSHYAQTGVIESYGLVGMLTSDASGPWNHSIFPMIILAIYIFRKKFVDLNERQLHISMAFMSFLYAQQFFFSLDLLYSPLEVSLMLITGSLFVVGMFSFLIPLFRQATTTGQLSDSTTNATTPPRLNQKLNSLLNHYNLFLAHFSHKSFKLLNWHPRNKHADKILRQPQLQKPNRKLTFIFAIDIIQLTLTMTLAMFALTFTMQFLFAQFGMSDAEAALFGTAGATSAPELFVASAAGPTISILLFVGSNIIDGWFSALGQTILISIISILEQTPISIPLASSIRHLTFLSFTQGLLVWLTMFIYSKYQNSKSLLSMKFLFISLLAANLYYFGLAWLSAQALGADKLYAQQNSLFQFLTTVISKLHVLDGQTIFLYANLIIILGIFIYKIFKQHIFNSPKTQ